MRNVTSRKAFFNNIHFPGNNLANVIFSYLVQAPEKASQGYFFRKTIIIIITRLKKTRDDLKNETLTSENDLRMDLAGVKVIQDVYPTS